MPASVFTIMSIAYDATGLAPPLYSVLTRSTDGVAMSDVSAANVWASTVSATNYIGLPSSPPGSGNSLFWTSALSVQVTGSNVTLDLPATVATGSYNSVTVDQYGRTTAAARVSYPVVSSMSTKLPAWVVRGSASSAVVISWAGLGNGDAIVHSIIGGAVASSLSSGLVPHSHTTIAGRFEFRLSNVSTLVQNQSSQSWAFTRIPLA